MQHLDPRAVIEEALTVTSTLFSEKSARLAVEIGGDLPMVYADRDRLIQVLVNLLSNAAKFCDERAGHVIVTAEARPEGPQISIVDNGRGVPPENRALIFEKFHQATPTLTHHPRRPAPGPPTHPPHNAPSPRHPP